MLLECCAVYESGLGKLHARVQQSGQRTDWAEDEDVTDHGPAKRLQEPCGQQHHYDDFRYARLTDPQRAEKLKEAGSSPSPTMPSRAMLCTSTWPIALTVQRLAT